MVAAGEGGTGTYAINELFTSGTELCACCCAWALSSPDILAYGTYECVDDASARLGHLTFLTCAGAEQPPTCAAQVPLPGVYDISWSPAAAAGRALCAVALGSGELIAFDCDLSGVDLQASLDQPLRHDVSPGSILTHVDASSDGFACSGQDGRLHFLAHADGGVLSATSWHAHGAEAWFVEAVLGEPSLLLSGADDCVLALWDRRTDASAGPAARNAKAHEAGVLSAACCPAGSGRFVTGSYDERVRLWDLRKVIAPLATGPRCGDGTYRVRWCTDGLVAVAAMRAGVMLLDASTLEVLQCHGHGKSDDDEAKEGIAYGLSVCTVDEAHTRELVRPVRTSSYPPR